MNNRERDDDENLDAWLARARMDPVPDEGFTAGLMKKLPLSRRRPATRGPLLGGLAGVALLGLQLGSRLDQLSLLPVMVASIAALGALAALWAYAERDS